jgi:outer membrane lipoprotein-sorting protein
MTYHNQKRLLRELAAQAIPDSLELWPGIQSRAARPASAAWRWGLGATAAALLVLALATLVFTSGPPPVSAEAILAEANLTTDSGPTKVRTYHVTSTTTLRPTDAGTAPIVQQDETWFGGPGRMRQQTHAPDWSSLIVTNGSQTWWAVTRGSQTYAAPAQGIRFSDTARLNPLAAEGSSIASLLANVRQRGCGTAELRGEETVAGRPAYVVSVVHTLREYCGDRLQGLAEASPSAEVEPTLIAREQQLVAGKKQTAVALQPNKFPAQASPEPKATMIEKPADQAKGGEVERLLNTPLTDTFWIDKETFVPLRAQQNLGPKGTSTYEVTQVTYDLTLADSLFEFEPPQGAHVLADPGAIKQALAGVR